MINTMSDKQVGRFMLNVVVRPDGCHAWTGFVNNHGYGQLRVGDRIVRAHRVAYMIAHGEIDDDRLCLHTCDNRVCVNPAHLYLGTPSDNVRDMVARRRQNNASRLGVLNGNAKLGESDVIKIRELYASGVNQCAIGRMYGVTNSAVHMIVKRKSWKHVPG